MIEEVVADADQSGKAFGRCQRRIYDFKVKDTVRLLDGGQLQFLLGAEMRVQPALGDAERFGQPADAQTFEALDGGQRHGLVEDGLARPYPVLARLAHGRSVGPHRNLLDN